MCGGVYVSQLLPFTAGLAGSMQEYEVWLVVWRGNSTLNEQLISLTSGRGRKTILLGRANWRSY